MPYILNDKTEFDSKNKITSDIIISSAILGFTLTRYYQNQPCQFDYEHPTEKSITEWEKLLSNKDTEEYGKYIKELQDQQNHFNILSTISHVIDHYEPGAGLHLLDGQSPLGKEGKLITGKKGSEGQKFNNRHGKMSISKAEMLENAFEKKGDVYRGRGAYTGMIDNPINDESDLYPTERVAYNTENTPLPLSGVTFKDFDVYCIDENSEDTPLPWGLIGGLINLSNDKSKGMGPIKAQDGHFRIGYVHGMCSAIVKCKHSGPWATPYEMATGCHTTKMASCFACTTYMYANGYPPSSIHLGRGESWVPPMKDYIRLEEHKDTSSQDLDYSNNCLIEWQREISAYIALGLDCINKTKKLAFLSETHKEQLDELVKIIFKNNFDVFGNEINLEKVMMDSGSHQHISEAFLEALTVHKKDSDRIKDTFNPLYEKYITLSEHSFT